jgi:hypothetical protein
MFSLNSLTKKSNHATWEWGKHAKSIELNLNVKDYLHKYLDVIEAQASK